MDDGSNLSGGFITTELHTCRGDWMTVLKCSVTQIAYRDRFAITGRLEACENGATFAARDIQLELRREGT